MKLLSGLIAGAVLVFIAYSFLQGGFSLTGSSVADNPCSALKGTAEDQCYFDAKKCSKMSDSPVRESCIAELAKAKNDLAICSLITDKKTQGFCVEEIAVQKNDASLCNTIADPYWADNCNLQIGTKNNEAQYCHFIINDGQQKECFKEIALATNNVQLCAELDEEERGSCIYTIAIHTKDIALCGELGHPVNRDACRLKVAKASNNKALCSAIKLRDIRRTCEEYFVGRVS
ncbi:MAG: hypothetical protein Q8R53_00085 [Nanoarchaeota archaeon]|nr:hypothetical protein [Nanoarchaeota archaeon]